MTDALTLPQALLLLTLKDDSGRPKAGFYKPALVGAGIAELLLRGAVTQTTDKTPKLVAAPLPQSQATSQTASHGPFLDFILGEITAAGRPRAMKQWITKLANRKQLVPSLAGELCELGALSEESVSLFGLFPLTRWPAASPALEDGLKAELAAAITGEGPVAARTSVILALAKSADVLRHNIDRAVLKTHRDRIKTICAGELLVSDATEAVIQATQAAITTAIMVAVILPAAT